MKKDDMIGAIHAFEDFCKEHGVRKNYSYNEEGIRFVVTLIGRIDVDSGISIKEVERPTKKKKPGKPRKTEKAKIQSEGVKND